MGNRFAIPEFDVRLERDKEIYKLTQHDIRGLWEGFLRVDKEHTGMCNLNDLFT